MVKQIRASSVASGDEPRHMGDAMLQAARGKDIAEHEVRKTSQRGPHICWCLVSNEHLVLMTRWEPTLTVAHVPGCMLCSWMTTL